MVVDFETNSTKGSYVHLLWVGEGHIVQSQVAINIIVILNFVSLEVDDGWDLILDLLEGCVHSFYSQNVTNYPGKHPELEHEDSSVENILGNLSNSEFIDLQESVRVVADDN